MMEEYLTPTQLAKRLKLSRQAVIDRIKRGTIKAIKVGRQYIIPEDQTKKSGFSEVGKKRLIKEESKAEAILRLVKEKGIQAKPEIMVPLPCGR